MENLIIGIIIFLITAVIQYFIKKNKAEKERGHTQSKNPHTFFDEIKEKFEKAMNDADVDYELISYPGALHAFSNPEADSTGKKFNMPIAYNKEADEKSWAEMQKFFKEIFK